MYTHLGSSEPAHGESALQSLLYWGEHDIGVWRANVGLMLLALGRQRTDTITRTQWQDYNHIVWPPKHKPVHSVCYS